MSRKLASASWSLLALASIQGAAQGHHVIFHVKGGVPPPPTTTTTTTTTIIIIIIVIVIVIVLVLVIVIVIIIIIIIIIIAIRIHFILIGNYWHYHES